MINKIKLISRLIMLLYIQTRMYNELEELNSYILKNISRPTGNFIENCLKYIPYYKRFRTYVHVSSEVINEDG